MDSVVEGTKNLNLFESRTPPTPTVIFRQIILTRLFILLLIIFVIPAGLYTFLLVETQMITIDKPSLATYEQLYIDHADTLQCPCSQKSISYGSFLNVTFDLHQVCSSDLVSPTWLNYLQLFDPIDLPEWAVSGATRDFRSIGGSYFQLLTAVCLLAQSNIENAQSLFSKTQFVNDRVLDSHLFVQQTNGIIQSYINRTIDDFRQTSNWLILVSISNYFLSGSNTNSNVTFGDNDIANIGILVYPLVEDINHEHISFNGVCTCPERSVFCLSLNLLYTTGKQPLEYEQIFWEIRAGCLPFATLLQSPFYWWYDQNYLEIIQDSYSRVIHTQSPSHINSLNTSLPSQYGDLPLFFLYQQMFTETPIRNATRFDLFYKQCAPMSCSYTISQRRDLVVILLLLISICGGLNEILHILVQTFGKSIFFLIDWWKNSDQVQRKPSDYFKAPPPKKKGIFDKNIDF